MWDVSDMSDRYAHDWATRSRDTKRSRQQGDTVQCSCCGGYYPWDDIEVHHANYQGENDRAGVNIFPICGSKQDPGTCHHWVHSQGNWIKDKWDPVWGNHNTRSVVKRLQRGYATGNPEGNGLMMPDRIPWLGIGAVAAIGLFALASLSKPKPTIPADALAAINGDRICTTTQLANIRNPNPIGIPTKVPGQTIGVGSKVTVEGNGEWLEVRSGQWSGKRIHSSMCR